MGARALYLLQGNKDTLYRIHGTNQPEYIGQAISSGCIRMTNEDVIDLFDRVKQGATVVVLAPGQNALTRAVAGRRTDLKSSETMRLDSNRGHIQSSAPSPIGRGLG